MSPKSVPIDAHPTPPVTENSAARARDQQLPYKRTRQDMTNPTEMQAKLIEEFRANDGKVASFGDGETKLLLLHSIGAKTGRERVTMLIYQDWGGSWAIFASNGGAPSHPAWYHNLIADPNVEIEVGSSKHKVIARVADEADGNEFGIAKEQSCRRSTISPPTPTASSP